LRQASPKTAGKLDDFAKGSIHEKWTGWKPIGHPRKMGRRSAHRGPAALQSFPQIYGNRGELLTSFLRPPTSLTSEGTTIFFAYLPQHSAIEAAMDTAVRRWNAAEMRTRSMQRSREIYPIPRRWQKSAERCRHAINCASRQPSGAGLFRPRAVYRARKPLQRGADPCALRSAGGASSAFRLVSAFKTSWSVSADERVVRPDEQRRVLPANVLS